MNLTDEEMDLIALTRLRPMHMAKYIKVIEIMVFRCNKREQQHLTNSAEVMALLGIDKTRKIENAMKKGAAMVLLRENGWTHEAAQKAVGLNGSGAGMSLRSARLHGKRMKNNLYKVTFAEVERKLGEWLRKKNKQTNERTIKL